MAEKTQTFLVTIAILEGRHYAWSNMDSAVVIRVDNKKRCTSVRQSSDCPFYNEYFVFEFFTTYEKLIDKNITMTVIQPKNVCRKRKTLGYITLDVATVWAQKDHQFYHKWAILGTPKSDVFSGPRGYLKVDISILAKGEVPKIPAHVINEEIEGNLLLPGTTNIVERQKALYFFEIFRCQNVVEKPSNMITNTENKNSNKSNDKGPTTYVEVTFAGKSVRTSIKKNTAFPVFNEKLTIEDLFPPLCQRIRIEICHGDIVKKFVHSLRFLNLSLISNDKEEGFLPTFGPTFLHMYFSNALDGYAGTILLSMNTELEELTLTAPKKMIAVQSISPIDEQKYFHYEDIILFATIFEVTAINKKHSDKPLSFRMTFGSALVQKDSAGGSGDDIITNSTIPQKPKKCGKNFYTLSIDEIKLCLRINTKAPYLRKRMFNSNLLSKIVNKLKGKLLKIEHIYEHQHYRINSNDIDILLTESLDYLSSAVIKYIDIASEYTTEYFTNLDKERRDMCLKEMKYISDKLNGIYENPSRRRTFRKLLTICSRIEALIEEVQDCWPDIFLWMVSGNKKVAYFQTTARSIIYSPVEEELGDHCGLTRSICFYANQKDQIQLACKMEVRFWLGLERYSEACFKIIPEGFKYHKESTVLPRNLVAEEKCVYQFRAHIFQGKVSSGFDKSGLADTFVRVTISDEQQETHTIKSNLNPIWDQTIVFKDITLFGSKSYREENFPMVLVEIFDRDEMSKSELVGRSLIKPVIKQKEDTIPIKLKWHKMYHNCDVFAEILSAFEFLEVSEKDGLDTIEEGKIISIPKHIKPEMISYKIEVLFWGVRNLRKVNLIPINRPRISFICGDYILNSDTIENAKKNPNFPNKVKSLQVTIPSQKEYAPPLCLKLYDSRRFGIYAYAGVHVLIESSFLFHPLTVEERNKMLSGIDYRSFDSLASSVASSRILEQKLKTEKTNYKVMKYEEKKTTKDKILRCWLCRCMGKIFKKTKITLKIKSSDSSLGTYELLPQAETDFDDFDWWTKFYASLGLHRNAESSEEYLASQKHKLKIYQGELENQPEFKGFNDMLRSFEIYKGKRTGDETVDEEHITAVFKGQVRIYRWPPPNNVNYVTAGGRPLKDGVYQYFPDNHPLRYLLRVYCIRGIGLRPMDMTGKSDPYLYLTLNDKVINDKSNVIWRQLNPVFGRCFEFNGTFPYDHTLTIEVWDYDIAKADDLIGLTNIDLEIRYYTKYRAFCGIAEKYERSGYCEWRGQHKPTTILSDLCKKWKTDPPEYDAASVRIGFKEFIPEDFIASEDPEFDREVLALTALRRWNEMPVIGFPLVPEHVETRSLFNPAKPGVEQGKLQMWIDLFPASDLPPPKQVIITPRKPIAYELRVIIWNTDEVVLDEDDFFIGEKKSDIYVKGWLADRAEAQYTDVHYRSLTGEGNFNWRFVFPFEYLATENKLVIRKKESVFAIDETEFKIPCRLTLQVWDNDTFSKDDFLGTLTLELSKMPRGARSAKKCSLSILDPHAPKVNLFKIRRTRGWWPFRSINPKEQTESLTGKVEAELEIVTSEEGAKCKAGLGRNEPQALPPPIRPDVSFSWFKNPLRALKFVVCKLHRRKIIVTIFFILLIGIIVLAVYSLPGYTVKRILGA